MAERTVPNDEHSLKTPKTPTCRMICVPALHISNGCHPDNQKLESSIADDNIIDYHDDIEDVSHIIINTMMIFLKICH